MLRMARNAPAQLFPNAFSAPHVDSIVLGSRTEAEIRPGGCDHCGSRRSIEQPNSNPTYKRKCANHRRQLSQRCKMNCNHGPTSNCVSVYMLVSLRAVVSQVQLLRRTTDQRCGPNF